MANIINGFDFDSLPITAVYVGKINDPEWEHYLWQVIIARQNGAWAFPYKCGLGHVEKKPGALPMPNPPYRKGTIAYKQWEETTTRPKKPSNSDIMYSLLMDSEASSESFNDWCSDFGYDTDSMKAFETYQACCRVGKELKATFSQDQIKAMKIALEDY